MRTPLARFVRRAAAILPGLAALAPARSALAQGCAMCGNSLGDPRLGDAFNASILFMMGAPYLVVAVAGGWIVYKHRAAGGRRADVIKLDPTGQRTPPPVPAEPAEGEPP